MSLNTNNKEKQTTPGPGDASSSLTISRISFEHRREPIGIGEANTRLSWLVSTTVVGWLQVGYEIEAYGLNGRLREGTGRVDSDQSVLVDWPFKPLSSREKVRLRLRVWGQAEQPSEWSQDFEVEAGLLEPADWAARFVTPDWDEGPARPQPSPYLRREFEIRGPVSKARLYITALGVYEAHLNGLTIGDHVLAPGWTSYHHRLRYQTFDVTGMLQEGANALGAILGDGWFRGRFGFGGGRINLYGDRLALLAQLEIEYKDGTTQQLITDPDWRATTGPIIGSSIYDRDTYDARLELPGWDKAGYDGRDWKSVRPLDWNFDTLIAPLGPPVRRTQTISPAAITTSPTGRTVVDFGQNLVGRLRLSVRGEAGQTITIRHAEVLQEGDIYTRPLRFAKQTDQYILRGEGLETWEPRFTFHGFRYAEVEGWPGQLKAEDLQAIVCHSDMERTGWFESSDPLINKLHENVVWSMRGNFLDLPTDCPQRDERLGWTADIQVFTPTASFLYDCAGFLTSWLADLAAEQTPEGIVPYIVPHIAEDPPIPTAAWGDAAVIVPWVLYQRFGDKGVLAAQFESMRRWVDHLSTLAGESLLWDEGFQYGDWLDPSAPPEDPAAVRTHPHLVATAHFAWSADLVGRIAHVLGRTEEQAHYLGLATRIRETFNNQYVTPNGLVSSDSATAYAMVLEFALLTKPEQRQQAGQRLATIVRDNRYLISTGFVGTPIICDALCSVGEYEAAFRLISQRECPSWLYPITMGATTIWERWDSMRPDGSVNPGQMTSFNHYALGAVADWLQRTIGGLAPAEPGYRRLEIQPRPGAGLTRATASHRTPYGLAKVWWEIEGGEIKVEVVVPPNTTARITLPGSSEAAVEVGAGTYNWAYPYQDPAAVRPPLSLDSTMSELRDNPAAFDVVAQVIERHLPGFRARRETRWRAYARTKVRDFLSDTLPPKPALIPDVEKALAGLEQ